MNDFEVIAEYIISCIAPIARIDIPDLAQYNTFVGNVTDFLYRLIDDPVNVTRDPLVEKAGRQLLCCIGIDLRQKIVDAQYYYNIFKTIDYSNRTLYARIQFNNTVYTNNLHYKNPMETSDVFRIIIRPVKDHKYYLEPFPIGLYGAGHTKVERDTVIEHIRYENPVIKRDDDKLTRNNNYKYFWATTDTDLQVAMDYPGTAGAVARCIANSVVDGLGLSHYCDFTADVMVQDFFSINLGTISVNHYKPNATIVPWDMAAVGFLSTHGTAGSTWSASGALPFVMAEKVFNEAVIPDADVANVVISMLPDSVIPPINLDGDALLLQGVVRFYN